MVKTKINFTVDKMAVLCNIMNGEIKARMDARKRPERREYYKKMGVIDSVPAITRFMNEHPDIFSNKKFIVSKSGNIFEEILPISSEKGKEVYKKEASRLVEVTHDLTENEKDAMDSFLEDFWELSESEEIKPIFDATNIYKDSIEDIWRQNEDTVMESIQEVLGGYTPEPTGSVSTYIMYPNFNIHRTSQTSPKQTNLFFANMKEKNPNKIVAYLAHQVVHQPMLPYTTTMTGMEKEKLHGFIKFLTDKDVYNRLTGKSYLDITTQRENPEVMAKIYPYWLGYRYRNADKQGLDPETEIAKAIARDKKYYDKLPESSKKKALYRGYEFDKLDPAKIASFFKEKKGMTPYQFTRINFENKRNTYRDDAIPGNHNGR